MTKEEEQRIVEQRASNIDIGAVYSGHLAGWYPPNDENKISHVNTSTPNTKPSVEGKTSDPKLFDSSTRLLDTARSRPDLLADPVTQQVIGDILKSVSPKLIGLPEFTQLVEEFMANRKGPPINMILGVPDKPPTHLKPKTISTEEQKARMFTGQPKLLAKNISEKLVKKKFTPATDGSVDEPATSDENASTGTGTERPDSVLYRQSLCKYCSYLLFSSHVLNAFAKY